MSINAIAIAACVAVIAVCFWALASLGDSCSKKHCSPGLKPTLMMQHRHVYRCVCVEEPQ